MNTYSQEIINSAKDLIQADKIANEALVIKWEIEREFLKAKSQWENDEIPKDQYFAWSDSVEFAIEQLRIANRKLEISLKEFRLMTHYLHIMRDIRPASLLNEAQMIIEKSNS